MKRLLHAIRGAVSSRALPPIVIGLFLLCYIGIAFVTEDALTALIAFTSKSIFLAALFALLPLNSASRIVLETGRYLGRRRALTGNAPGVPAGLFDETVELPASSSLAELEGRLGAVGYRTRRTEGALTAWRGVGSYPARILYLAGAFCLFAGILISFTSRTSYRQPVIEGEPFPTPSGEGGIVTRISLGMVPGPILDKHLTMEVADPGSGKKEFGIYPPSIYSGAFVYPRYLGVGLLHRFSAPDLATPAETFSVLNIYPPGREAAAEIPGSSYRIVFSLAVPDDGADPYATGRMVFLFKLLKGKEVVLTGSAPRGGEFVQNGYRLAFPDARRLVITDLIRDNGVILIWTAGILFLAAGGVWLAVRVFLPRREMLFLAGENAINAFSRAEGRTRRHAGVFHEALDLLETRRNV